MEQSYKWSSQEERLDLPTNVGTGTLRSAGSWITTFLLSERGTEHRAEILRSVMKEVGITTEHLQLLEGKWELLIGNKASKKKMAEWQKQWDALEGSLGRGDG